MINRDQLVYKHLVSLDLASTSFNGMVGGAVLDMHRAHDCAHYDNWSIACSWLNMATMRLEEAVTLERASRIRRLEFDIDSYVAFIAHCTDMLAHYPEDDEERRWHDKQRWPEAKAQAQERLEAARAELASLAHV